MLRRSRGASLFLVFGLLNLSRDARAEDAPEPRVAPRYAGIRYLEDWSDPARRPGEDPFDRVKYLPLGEQVYLSLGGQHRLRYELTSGLSGPLPESVLFSRNLLHADVHVGGLRTFVQFGGQYALGAPARDEPPGSDLFDVQQAFIEWTTAPREVRVTARVGRQELALGSTRWVSTRDGTNVRQAFDLVRLTVTGATWNVEGFGGFVPRLERGGFDDAPSTRNRFWGVYATLAILPRSRLSLDAFYLGRDRPSVTYAEVSGREVRHTFGVRAFGQTDGGLEYIGHALAQFGTVGDTPILAWGLAGGLWQRLPLAPLRLGVRADALSGDARADDGRVSTFHAYFPNQTFFSALPLIYPSNLYEVHPLVQWELDAVTLEAGCVFFFRQSVRDAVYTPPGGVLVPPVDSDARYTGAQLSLSLGYRITRHVMFNAEYSHVVAGPALRAVTGRDVDFLGTWTTFTY
ncbi:alginate export family protein [Corallococcus sp. M34]|uniref:alginate export family protein n=1 Tax=Citreicoccus inhibens TaxID=2849499 RepID=UPI001C24C8C7|nr:alginate export family protein [Citreicoccus inhibens]MBU8899634.1 alginate export family protein [Citreicoccus inhibens]